MGFAKTKPEDFARALLSRLGTKQPANLDDVARAIGLRVRKVNSKGFEGALVRVPGMARGIVAVRADIRELGRERFTVAHEIGHYVLPGHGATSPVCRDEQIEAWGQGATRQEDAANRFASELLLPSEQIGPVVRERSASIGTARFISDEFKTSLTAAALKCVEVTEDACALVVSVDGVVRRCRTSRSWGYVIPAGCTLARGTLARHLDLEERQASGTVSASAWAVSKSMTTGAELLEDSIYLPRYNTVLSILTAIGA
ncbi:MAG: ImmA/IrrE family metallo-endopeptidase [Acidobacteria bacterium]|nr:ImmA/IrrE family metallo-endopeptidase [Acidobacteriota bacterium]